MSELKSTIAFLALILIVFLFYFNVSYANEINDVKNELSKYKANLKNDQKNCFLLEQVAVNYEVLLKFDRSIHYYKKAIENCSNNTITIFNLGKTYLLNKQKKLGTQNMDKAIKQAIKHNNTQLANTLSDAKKEWLSKWNRIKNINYQDMNSTYFRRKLKQPLKNATPKRSKPLLDECLVYMYGQSQNHEKALKCFHEAAEKGYVKSYFYIGLIYEKGEGIDKDYSKAIKWYRKAAIDGHAEAQVNLAIMYINGHGCDKDYIKAYKWLYISQTYKNKDTNKLRNFLSEMMSSDKIAKAKRLAKEWNSTRNNQY